MKRFSQYEGTGGPTAWSNGIKNFPAFHDYVFESNAFAKTVDLWAQRPTDALLLFGDYGSGKTEMAKRLPSYMEKDFNYAGSFHLIDCADSQFEPKKDILSKLTTVEFWGTPFFVLDEADQLSGRKQVNLRNIIQEYSHLLNVVITTNQYRNIDDGILSRSTKVHVKFPELSCWVGYVRAQLGPKSNRLISDKKILKAINASGCTSGRDINRTIGLLKAKLGI